MVKKNMSCLPGHRQRPKQRLPKCFQTNQWILPRRIHKTARKWRQHRKQRRHLRSKMMECWEPSRESFGVRSISTEGMKKNLNLNLKRKWILRKKIISQFRKKRTPRWMASQNCMLLARLSHKRSIILEAANWMSPMYTNTKTAKTICRISKIIKNVEYYFLTNFN